MGTQQEIAAIERVVADAERLQNDLEGFTSLLTRDVSIVNIAGRQVLGWDQVYDAYKQALGSPLVDVRTTYEVEDIRFLRPDVVLVSCIKRVVDEREPSEAPDKALPQEASTTFVLLKEEDRWLIASAQTTPRAS